MMIAPLLVSTSGVESPVPRSPVRASAWSVVLGSGSRAWRIPPSCGQHPITRRPVRRKDQGVLARCGHPSPVHRRAWAPPWKIAAPKVMPPRETRIRNPHEEEMSSVIFWTHSRCLWRLSNRAHGQVARHARGSQRLSRCGGTRVAGVERSL